MKTTTSNHIRQRWAVFVGFLLLTLTAGFGRAQSVFPGAQWQEATPASQGVDATKLGDAMTYLQSVCGSQGVNQAVIVRNGYIIWKGSDIDNNHNTWSCTKSFTSTVLGLLIDDGQCTLDTLAKDHVTSLVSQYPNLKLRHFATMTSGYNASGGDQSTTPFTVAAPLFSPGAKFLYWDSAMNQFGNTLTRIAGQPIENLFKTRIADPIQINATKWNWNDWGTVDGYVVNGGAGNQTKGMIISAREMARFGLLFLNRGNWNGNQLISASWVDQATTTQVAASLPMHEPANSTGGPGRYGFNWWCNGIQPNGTRPWPAAPAKTYRASGFNNNTCTVIPEWNMVVVRLGTDGSTVDDAEWSTFFGKLGLAITSAEPLPGQIMQDPVNPRGLVYNRDADGDGKKDPFVMVAPGGPEGFLYLSATEQNNILTAMEQNGGNAMYLMAVRSHGGDGTSTHNPFIGNNPNNGVNMAVLDNWDALFTRMHDAGIVVYFFFYDDSSNPFGVTNPTTNPNVPAAEKAFFETIVHRFRSFPNLIWVISEEYEERMSAARASALGAIIRAADPHAHVIGNHQLGNNLTFDFPSDANIKQYAMQANVTNLVQLHADVVAAVNDSNNRWHVNLAENANHANSLAAGDRIDVRRRNWSALMAGAHVMAYGTWETGGGTPTAAMLADMKRAQNFLESVNFNELVPSDSLAHGGSTWVLAKTGDSYIAYSSANPANLGVKSLTAGTYDLKWFDPIDGSSSTQTAVSVAGGDTTFTKPTHVAAEAVLYLKRVGGGSVPGAPSNLTATAVSTSQINLSWNDNSNNETQFRIERKTGTGTYSFLVNKAANATTHNDTGLQSGTSYTYRVRAENANGNSAFSNEATATTQSPGGGLISNLSVASGKAYVVVSSLANGELVYIDRTFTYTNVASYTGKTFIRTANDDKNRTEASFLSFDVNQAVTVYVAYDIRATSLPNWLNSWTDTGDIIGTTDQNRRVYSKEYSAGTVTLGANAATGMVGAGSMYSVIVTSSSTSGAFQESSGEVVMEGEHFHALDGRTDPNSVNWQTATSIAGAVGGQYVETPGPQGTNGDWSNGCEVSYNVNFTTTGTYNVWVRRYAVDGAQNSISAGLNGVQTSGVDNTTNYGSWVWKNLGTVSVTSAGVKTFQLRRREAGYKVDRIVLRTSATAPSGNGPAESPQSGGGGGDIVNGLAGNWKLNETTGTTASDSSGNNLNGTLLNGPVWSSGTLAFDGVNDYVSVGNPAQLQFTGAMTLSAWVKANTLSGRIIAKQGGTSNRGWTLNFEPAGFASFAISDSANTIIRADSGTLATNTWYHLVGVYEPGTAVRLYVNAGTPFSNTTAIPTSQRNSTLDVNIGRRPDASGYFNGNLDDVRAYNRVLSAAEVTTLFNNGPQ